MTTITTIEPGVNTTLTTELNNNFDFLEDVSIKVQSVQDEVLSEVNRLNTHFSRSALSLTTASTSGVVAVTVENTDAVNQFNTSFGNIDDNVIAMHTRSTEINNEIDALNTANGTIPAPIDYSYVKGTESFDVYSAGVDTSLSSKLNNGFGSLYGFTNDDKKILSEAITQINAIALDESLSGYSSSSVTLQTPGTITNDYNSLAWEDVLPKFNSLFNIRAPQGSTTIDIAYNSTDSLFIWGTFNLETETFTTKGYTSTANKITTSEIEAANPDYVSLESDNNIYVLDDGGLVYDVRYSLVSETHLYIKTALRHFDSDGTIVFSSLTNLIYSDINGNDGPYSGTIQNLLSSTSSTSSFAYATSTLIGFGGLFVMRYYDTIRDRRKPVAVCYTYNPDTNAISINSSTYSTAYDDMDENPVANMWYLRDDAFYCLFNYEDKIGDGYYYFRYMKYTTSVSNVTYNRFSTDRDGQFFVVYAHLNTVGFLNTSYQSGRTNHQHIAIYDGDTAIYENFADTNTEDTSKSFGVQRHINATEYYFDLPDYSTRKQVDTEGTNTNISSFSDLAVDSTRYYWSTNKPYTFDGTHLKKQYGSTFVVDTLTNTVVESLLSIGVTPILNSLIEAPTYSVSDSDLEGWTSTSARTLDETVYSSYKLASQSSPIIIYEVT